MTEAIPCQGKRLGTRLSLPLIVAPMFLVSGPQLVIAACRCGVIGSFPATNARSLAIYGDWLEQITQALQTASPLAPAEALAPWAANLIVHSSYRRLAAELALVRRYQPPIVITALGSPAAVIDSVHAYGGLVLADVNTVAFARKAAAAGVDGLVLVCNGAGGHTGELSAFVFVSQVREFFDGIIVLAGGISDGRAIRAAEVLGADLAYMGTSFIATDESLASEDYKKMVVEAGPADLMLSSAFTGANAYYLRQSIVRTGLAPDKLPTRDGPAKDGMDLSHAEQQIKAWRDIWSAGQGVGTVDGVSTTAELVAKFKRQYAAAVSLDSKAMDGPGAACQHLR